MVAFIKYRKWKCESCTEVIDTDNMNERPMCPHKEVVWDAGKPVVLVTLHPMRLLEEFYI